MEDIILSSNYILLLENLMSNPHPLKDAKAAIKRKQLPTGTWMQRQGIQRLGFSKLEST